MKADISRDTFQAARHIRRVVAQQGRPSLDSDWNEQVAALLHRLESMAADVFGEHAAIEDGFKIEPIGGKKFAFAVQRGRYYLHGLMCENEEALEFDHLNSLQDKTHFVYLYAWEQYESSMEDPAIAEPALNGVETCGRSTVGWSVNWAEKTATVSDWKAFFKKQKFDAQPARLKLRAKAIVDERSSAHPDRRTVYRGLDNVLYRLEVHDVPENGTPRFKWARNNASSLTPVSAKGSTLTWHGSTELDSAFQPNAWVELSREAGLQRQEPSGELHQIKSVSPDSRTIELSVNGPAGSDAVAVIGAGKSSSARLFARPWAGVEFVKPTGFQPFDGGLEVSFDRERDRLLRPGQHWLIAVRTNGGGQVYWPDAGKRPNVYQWGSLNDIDSSHGVVPQEADMSTHRSAFENHDGKATYGRRHYYGPLAVIQFDAGGNLTLFDDLRKPRVHPK
jgi:hypothetical protein